MAYCIGNFWLSITIEILRHHCSSIMVLHHCWYYSWYLSHGYLLIKTRQVNHDRMHERHPTSLRSHSLPLTNGEQNQEPSKPLSPGCVNWVDIGPQNDSLITIVSSYDDRKKHFWPNLQSELQPWSTCIEGILSGSRMITSIYPLPLVPW